MVLEFFNRGIEQLQKWWMMFINLFPQGARSLARAYYTQAMALSSLDMAAAGAASGEGNGDSGR